jgi:hypothetical protein
MAVIDDLIIAGFSIPQAQTVIADGLSSGGSSIDNLVAAGFTTTQAIQIDLYLTGTNGTLATADSLTSQGIWAGTQVAAIAEA